MICQYVPKRPGNPLSEVEWKWKGTVHTICNIDSYMILFMSHFMTKVAFCMYLHVRLNPDEGVSTGNFVELLKVSELPTYSRCNGGGVGMNTVSGLMDCALR